MKKALSIISVLLVLVMVFGCLSISAFAATSDAPFEFVDTSKKGSLELTFQNNGVKFGGKEVNIYRVATVSSNILYSITDEFKSKPVDEFKKITAPKLGETVDYGNLATTLYGYVNSDKITATASGKTDDNGVVKFDNLPLGLYLVSPVVSKIDKTTYTFSNFMIAVPNAETKANSDECYWEYNVKAAVKCSTVTDATEHKIIIIFEDEDPSKRPEKIEVEIFKDGKSYGKVTLTANDNWTYSWKEIDNGCVWSIAVLETESGYTYSTELKDTTFYVTARCKASPKTSDSFNYQVFLAVMALSLLGAVVVSKKVKE